MFKEKYYHVKNNYSGRVPNTIEFLGKNMAIAVREDWNDEPCIMVELSKELITDIPKSNEYMKTTRIEKSLFDTYYANNLRFLGQNFPEQAEYYISSSSQELIVHGYTDKYHLQISVDCTINYFSCKIALNRGIRGRNSVRKKHELISEAQAKQFFQLTLEYFYDRYTIPNLKEDYWNQINQLVKEDKPIKGLILNADVAFNKIREQIENRIKEVENRLINFDDTNEKRLELRGELKGLRYSLMIMDSHR